MLRAIALVTVLGSMAGEGAAQADPVRVVTTLPVYADLVEKIGGAEVDVSAIAAPNEDAHFVRPKPSFALSLRRADLFITTGLDLELWAADRVGPGRKRRRGRRGQGVRDGLYGDRITRRPRNSGPERRRRAYFR